MNIMKNVRAFIATILLCLGISGSAFAQGYTFNMHNGSASGPSVFLQKDPTTGLYGDTGFLGFTKHIAGGAQAPAVSTCGTSPALTSGSSDIAGKITVGTTASNACTLTFAAAWTAAPFCIVQNLTTGAAANVYAVSTTTIIWSSALADSTVLMYHCTGASGG